MKKLILFAVFIIAATMSACAYDFSAVCSTGQTLYYKILNENVQLCNENDLNTTYDVNYNIYPSGDFVIPSSVTYNGISYSVTSIGSYAFSWCTGLNSVSIPNTITSISNYAFFCCTGLTSVDIPNTLDSIGVEAFGGCSGLCTLIVPSSVTYIGDYAFVGVKNVVYNGSATGLWANCINGYVDGYFIYKDSTKTFLLGCCTSVEGTLTIPQTVDSIGAGAFGDCIGLCTLIVPSSVIYIGYGAFSDVKNVVYNGIATGSPWGAINGYVDGYFTYKDSTKTFLLSCCTSVEGQVIIPSTVDTIGSFAFYGCDKITSVEIPTSVVAIGVSSFRGCNGLTVITLPNTLTCVGENAFHDCNGLTTVNYNITRNNTSGNTRLFLHCPYLTTLNIGENVQIISSNTFYGCTNVNTVNYNATNCTNASGAFSYCSSLSTLNIGENVQSIPTGMFSGLDSISTVNYNAINCTLADGSSYGRNPLCYAHTLNIGENVQTIPSYLFYDAGLTGDLIIPNSVTTIGERAFGFDGQSLGGLASVTLGNSVTSIGDYAFSRCGNINTITIPQAVSYIGYGAFNNCGLTNVEFNATNCSVELNLQYQTSVFQNNPITSFHFSENTNVNPYRLCYGLNNIHSVTIGNNTLTVASSNTSLGKVNIKFPANYLLNHFLLANAYDIADHYHPIWSDGNSSTIDTIFLTESRDLVAYFLINRHTITVGVNDTTMGSIYFPDGDTADYGDTLRVFAIPAEHHHVTSWDNQYTHLPDTTIITSSDRNFVWVPMTSNRRLTCNFAIDTFTVTATTSNIAHGYVSVSGTEFFYGNPCTVTATAYSGYTFSGWSNGMTDNPYTFAVLNDVDLIAYFVPTGSQPTTYYTITAVASNPSMGSVTGGGSYASGTTATLTASANSGYHFTRWQDNVTSNPRTITVTGNATYTAYFESDGGGEQPSDNAPSIACVGVDMNGHNVVRWEPRQGVAVVRYNIYREGLGGYSQVGYVNATNATEYSWVDDNSNTATQAYSYKISEVSANGTESDLSLPHTTMHLQISQGQGTTWNLSWTPYVGFNYSGYRIYRGTTSASMSLLTELSSSATTYSDNAPSGDVYYQIEVVTSGAKSITASSRSNIATSVQNQQFTITVLSDNTSMGTVSGGGTFAEGATATISATPLNGYTFSQWSDGSTQAQRTITVTGNATYTAYFTAGGSQPQQYLITVVSNNPERGTVSGGGLYDAGAVITITAEPFAGFEFVKWQDGNTEDFRTITVTADATYTAYFRTATEGINDVKTTDNLKIYTRGNIIVIDFSGQQAADGRQSVVVYDVMGRVIKQAVGSGQQAVVEIPVSGTGVYMVKVGDMKPQKVVVRR